MQPSEDVGTRFSDDELVPLSALQHLIFCERQCALIHLEQVWVENRLTAEGRLLHEVVDSGLAESRGDLRIARGLALRSRRLGLSGRADALELHRAEAAASTAVAIPGLPGWWHLFPVEYKRGQPKPDHCDEVQLCAQALCLEEMLAVEIPSGALYYARPRRRQDVDFDPVLRRLTVDAAERLHRLLRSGRTPPAVRAPKCRGCSLLEVCLPDALQSSARAYLERMLATAQEEESV